ncbi:MAG TPA: hypothetical protein GXZ24_07230 [Firmicutes bacterium]|jgi:hypothetical protein|nr:hypothetical protein [Bacillota bacterium]
MPWLIFAVLVWIVVLLIVRPRGLARLWSAFFWSIPSGFFPNQIFVSKGLYQFQESQYFLGDVPLFYLVALGGLAVIVMRFLPEHKIWQFPYLILCSLVLMLLQIFALSKNYILFIQWSLIDSFIFILIALITIVWLSSLTIRKQEKRYYF